MKNEAGKDKGVNPNENVRVRFDILLARSIIFGVITVIENQVIFERRFGIVGQAVSVINSLIRLSSILRN